MYHRDDLPVTTTRARVTIEDVPGVVYVLRHVHSLAYRFVTLTETRLAIGESIGVKRKGGGQLGYYDVVGVRDSASKRRVGDAPLDVRAPHYVEA